jgi:flagellin-like protein
LTRIKSVRKTTKFKRSIRAISPVIATLLMIAIAVVASLVVYAWVSGYIGGSTSKAGNSIQIQSFASSGGNLVVYVQNVGQGVVTLKPGQSLYVNGDLVPITGSSDITIAEGQTVELDTNTPYSGEKVNIKVTTSSGTFAQSTGTGSSTTIQALIHLNPSSGQVGQTVTVSGSGFTASATISATFDGSAITIGSPSTDVSGAFTGVTFTIPSTTDGIKTVIFSTGTKSASSAFAVTTPIKATPTVSDPTLSPSGTVTVNTPVTISTTVSGGSGTPTGTALFQVKIGTGAWTDIGTAITLGSGAASTTYTPATADSYQFQVIYSGDSNYNGATSDTTSLTVNLPASVLDHFNFATISSPQTTGTAYSVTITAIDQYGATLTSYTGNPALTSTSWTGNLQLGAFASGTKTGTVTSTVAGSTSIIATDGSKIGTSNTFTVSNPAPVLDHFTFSTISSTQTAGTAFSITITAKDTSGNTVTSYTGTNTLTVSSGTINPTSTTAFTAGVWTGSVTITQAGTGLSISTTGGGKSGTSGTFTVNAGAASKFAFNTISTQTAGTAFSITITAQDAYGNTATSYTGNPTLTYSAGTISPTSSGAFTSGTKTVSVTVTKADTGVSITATSGTLTGTSSIFNVNAGAATKLVYTVVDSSVARYSRSTVFTFQRQDANNNPVTSGAITITLDDSTSSGSFYLASSGGSTITTVQMADGSSTVNFYWEYDGSSTSSRTLTASYGSLTSATTTVTVT